MTARALGTLLPWGLGAFFIIGGIVNGAGSQETRAQYAAWGYPDWFCYVTAALEVIAAALLFFWRTRIVGAALGTAVMGAAAVTLLRNGELLHMLAPVTVAALSILAGRTALRRRATGPVRAAAARGTNPWADAKQ